ncbi:M23 family metallopeptidase [Metabacillus sp. FJAT-52054]|uniref:M23 family metallopeptidase n=1 Tax=Metabacillus sediminis TaxID=3117746 RepID=A0ABZ2NIT9_9BACI
MKKGQTYKGNPLKNESYYAFGQPVAAPLEGTVIKTVDGLKDNVPGELNPDHPEGNYVVIKHKNGEYSILAHFMKNSIKVREGEKVKTGQILGKCGNSGNSTEAHIHFQVSSSPDIMTGKSIRIQFENGKEPVRGEYTRK